MRTCCRCLKDTSEGAVFPPYRSHLCYACARKSKREQLERDTGKYVRPRGEGKGLIYRSKHHKDREIKDAAVSLL